MKRIAMLIVLVLLIGGGWWLLAERHAPSTPAAGKVDGAALKDPALIAKGEYLATVGDCASCHTAPTHPVREARSASPAPTRPVPRAASRVAQLFSAPALIQARTLSRFFCESSCVPVSSGGGIDVPQAPVAGQVYSVSCVPSIFRMTRLLSGSPGTMSFVPLK